MNPILTYLDSGVLIAAARGIDLVSRKATLILDSQERTFSCSSFVRLEVLSKAIYHQRQNEVNFYETFFASCQIWATNYHKITQLAENMAANYGLNALDALQIAAAISVNSAEFITTEKSTKPLHRVTEIKVISINN